MAITNEDAPLLSWHLIWTSHLLAHAQMPYSERHEGDYRRHLSHTTLYQEHQFAKQQ